MEYKLIEEIHREVYYSCRLKVSSKTNIKSLNINRNEEIKVKYSFINKSNEYIHYKSYENKF